MAFSYISKGNESILKPVLTCFQNRQVFSLYRLNLQRFPTLGIYLKFWFIHVSVLFRIWFRQVKTIPLTCYKWLFRIWFRQVKTIPLTCHKWLFRIWFRQVKTIPLTCHKWLFRIWFKQVLPYHWLGTSDY